MPIIIIKYHINTITITIIITTSTTTTNTVTRINKVNLSIIYFIYIIKKTFYIIYPLLKFSH